MRTIVDVWRVAGKIVLTLDAPIPKVAYWNFSINGRIYKPLPVYDMPRTIGIDDDGSEDLFGATVVFI